MKVFNLTSKPLDYRGVVLSPNGGSHDYRDMSYVPSRDRTLVEKKIISFGNLPQWWLDEQDLKRHHMRMADKEAKVLPLPTAVKAVEATEDASSEAPKREHQHLKSRMKL